MNSLKFLIYALEFLLISIQWASSVNIHSTDDDRKTYIVKFKERNTIVPIKIEIYEKDQTEYVMNLDPATNEGRTITIYDYKKKYIAYKDTVLLWCFVAKMKNAKSIHKENDRLQDLQNTVVDSDQTENLTASILTLSSSALRSIAGPKIAEFCKGFQTSLVFASNETSGIGRSRSKRSTPDDHIQRSYQQFGQESKQFAQFSREVPLSGTPSHGQSQAYSSHSSPSSSDGHSGAGVLKQTGAAFQESGFSGHQASEVRTSGNQRSSQYSSGYQGYFRQGSSSSSTVTGGDAAGTTGSLQPPSSHSALLPPWGNPPFDVNANGGDGMVPPLGSIPGPLLPDGSESSSDFRPQSSHSVRSWASSGTQSGPASNPLASEYSETYESHGTASPEFIRSAFGSNPPFGSPPLSVPVHPFSGVTSGSASSAAGSVSQFEATNLEQQTRGAVSHGQYQGHNQPSTSHKYYPPPTTTDSRNSPESSYRRDRFSPSTPAHTPAITDHTAVRKQSGSSSRSLDTSDQVDAYHRRIPSRPVTTNPGRPDERITQEYPATGPNSPSRDGERPRVPTQHTQESHASSGSVQSYLEQRRQINANENNRSPSTVRPSYYQSPRYPSNDNRRQPYGYTDTVASQPRQPHQPLSQTPHDNNRGPISINRQNEPYQPHSQYPSSVTSHASDTSRPLSPSYSQQGRPISSDSPHGYVPQSNPSVLETLPATPESRLSYGAQASSQSVSASGSSSQYDHTRPLSRPSGSQHQPTNPNDGQESSVPSPGHDYTSAYRKERPYRPDRTGRRPSDQLYRPENRTSPISPHTVFTPLDSMKPEEHHEPFESSPRLQQPPVDSKNSRSPTGVEDEDSSVEMIRKSSIHQSIHQSESANEESTYLEIQRRTVPKLVPSDSNVPDETQRYPRRRRPETSNPPEQPRTPVTVQLYPSYPTNHSESPVQRREPYVSPYNRRPYPDYNSSTTDQEHVLSSTADRRTDRKESTSNAPETPRAYRPRFPSYPYSRPNQETDSINPSDSLETPRSRRPTPYDRSNNPETRDYQPHSSPTFPPYPLTSGTQVVNEQTLDRQNRRNDNLPEYPKGTDRSIPDSPSPTPHYGRTATPVTGYGDTTTRISNRGDIPITLLEETDEANRPHAPDYTRQTPQTDFPAEDRDTTSPHDRDGIRSRPYRPTYGRQSPTRTGYPEDTLSSTPANVPVDQRYPYGSSSPHRTNVDNPDSAQERRIYAASSSSSQSELQASHEQSRLDVRRQHYPSSGYPQTSYDNPQSPDTARYPHGRPHRPGTGSTPGDTSSNMQPSSSHVTDSASPGNGNNDFFEEYPDNSDVRIDFSSSGGSSSTNVRQTTIQESQHSGSHSSGHSHTHGPGSGTVVIPKCCPSYSSSRRPVSGEHPIPENALPTCCHLTQNAHAYQRCCSAKYFLHHHSHSGQVIGVPCTTSNQGGTAGDSHQQTQDLLAQEAMSQSGYSQQGSAGPCQVVKRTCQIVYKADGKARICRRYLQKTC